MVNILKKNNVMFLARTAVVAASYIALTLVPYSLSYGPVQFRVSEIFVLLCFVDPFYAPALVIGCFFSNLLGPYGIIDAVFGSFHTLIYSVMIILTARFIKKKPLSLFIASLWPSIFSFIIAFEIVFVFGAVESFWFWTLMVAVGEFVVVTVFGTPVFYYILKNENLTAKLKFWRGKLAQ